MLKQVVIQFGCLLLCMLALPVSARPSAAASAAVAQEANDGVAEARLIGIYRLIGKADTRQALAKAEQLVRDYPHFALAQLVYGDLLSARTRALQRFGDVPDDLRKVSNATLADLQRESLLRLTALRERPPKGVIPAELLLLSPRNKHAIAVDASRARLYLFENRSTGVTLVADYYVSIGKLGPEKRVEGDLRTPLGVYFITSLLDPKNLKDFYGSGALPINYPNVLDQKRGKTGSGIWLHGTPPDQFSRAPMASDGCVVVANPDLERIIRTVEIRSTPVVISQRIEWVVPQSTEVLARQFDASLQAWLKAKSSGDINKLMGFYAQDFENNGKSLAQWLPALSREVKQTRGRALELKDLNLLHWVDTEETMVATFGEVVSGQRSGITRRQYWSKRGDQWKIIYEGVNG